MHLLGRQRLPLGLPDALQLLPGHVHRSIRWIVRVAIREHQPHILVHLGNVVVVVGSDLLLDRAEIHRLLNHLEVVRDVEKGRVCEGWYGVSM